MVIKMNKKISELNIHRPTTILTKMSTTTVSWHPLRNMMIIMNLVNQIDTAHQAEKEARVIRKSGDNWEEAWIQLASTTINSKRRSSCQTSILFHHPKMARVNRMRFMMV